MTGEPREDAFALGARLKAEEAEARKHRIERALEHHTVLGGKMSPREVNHRIAESLYNARYMGYEYRELPDAQEILDNFCDHWFGCTYEETLDAWNRFLG